MLTFGGFQLACLLGLAFCELYMDGQSARQMDGCSQRGAAVYAVYLPNLLMLTR